MKKLLPFLLILLSHVPILLSASTPPNILWITNEDTSPAWGCYGDTYATTPNIDALAKKGRIFTRAYSNAPICAPARSTLITGMYATSLGTQHLRSEIPVPEDLEILPQLLKKAGYFTTNNAKTDYNFSAADRWDENGNDAHWRHRPDGKPFFSVFNFGITHEGNTNSLNRSLTAQLEKKHDPADATLPPYFPDTEAYRELWAHAYDLMTAFDQEVGRLVAELDEAGELENTIIFVFSDHGWGLPRHKRWLYSSGLQVPFVLYVPEKFRPLTRYLEAGEVDKMVGFVDMAPTVLQMAGLPAPAHMEGHSFLENTGNSYIFGYRDRADDAYDMSRAVTDGRYFYIRNYMPMLPYIQNAVIYNAGKAGYEELFRLEGDLPEAALEMFEPKAVEELYDMEQDPYMLRNLLDENPSAAHRSTANQLHQILNQWMIRTHDTGLMNEGIMMHRAAEAGTSVYEMARDPALFHASRYVEAAEKVGRVTSADQLFFDSEDPVMLYWSLVALEQLGIHDDHLEILKALENNSSPVIAAYASRLLVTSFNQDSGLVRLRQLLREDEEPVMLQIAIQVRLLGQKGTSLVPYIRDEIFPRYQGTVWGRYKNWSYPMFIGMALDQSMINGGEKINIRN